MGLVWSHHNPKAPLPFKSLLFLSSLSTVPPPTLKMCNIMRAVLQCPWIMLLGHKLQVCTGNGIEACGADGSSKAWGDRCWRTGLNKGIQTCSGSICPVPQSEIFPKWYPRRSPRESSLCLSWQLSSIGYQGLWSFPAFLWFRRRVWPLCILTSMRFERLKMTLKQLCRSITSWSLWGALDQYPWDTGISTAWVEQSYCHRRGGSNRTEPAPAR